MSKISLFFLFTAYCLLLATYCCEAGTISITTNAITWIEAGKIHGKIHVTNVGNAPAHELRADTEILGERFATQLAATLGPHESTSFQFSKPVDPSLKGSYPLVVLIHFQDANRHPFTALSCSTFSSGEKVDVGLSATAETLDLKDDGTLHFVIRNESDQPRQVRATLRLPREISCPNPVRDVEVAPQGKRAVSFPVRNLSALPGAGYPVFLSQEYGSGSTHIAIFSNGFVRIAKDANWLRETRWYWALGFAIILAGLVIISLIQRKDLTCTGIRV